MAAGGPPLVAKGTIAEIDSRQIVCSGIAGGAIVGNVIDAAVGP